MVEINVLHLYSQNGLAEQAKLSKLDEYCNKALSLVQHGDEVVLTGPGPVWLYLKIACVLYTKVTKLIYKSPVTGEVEVLNFNTN